MAKIGIIGAGTWGLALARMLCNSGHEVTVWSSSRAQTLAEKRSHPKLPGMVLPQAIEFTGDLQPVCEGKDVLVFAVPSVHLRATAEKARDYIPAGQVIVDVAKGIEPDTLLTMTGVIKDALQKEVKLVALSGPTHAEEVARDLPTTIVSACEDIATAEYIQDIFMNTCLRVYTNTDVLGVELCGAMKNIMALAAGAGAGLGYGDNTKAALITRGMAEITRLGKAMGAREQTFAGLAGMGDLIVTCTSQHSRNNRCGELIGQGVPVKEAVEQIGMVVEGINAIPAALKLKELYHVDMPIVTAVDAVVNHGADPRAAVNALMERERKPER